MGTTELQRNGQLPQNIWYIGELDIEYCVYDSSFPDRFMIVVFQIDSDQELE